MTNISSGNQYHLNIGSGVTFPSLGAPLIVYIMSICVRFTKKPPNTDMVIPKKTLNNMGLHLATKRGNVVGALQGALPLLGPDPQHYQDSPVSYNAYGSSGNLVRAPYKRGLEFL